MTTDDIDPTILAKIRANAEAVIVDTQDGWRLGVRGLDTFIMGNCFGRLTITEDDQVFHSMVGSRPTYNLEEAYNQVADLAGKAAEITRAINRMMS